MAARVAYGTGTFSCHVSLCKPLFFVATGIRNYYVISVIYTPPWPRVAYGTGTFSTTIEPQLHMALELFHATSRFANLFFCCHRDSKLLLNFCYIYATMAARVAFATVSFTATTPAFAYGTRTFTTTIEPRVAYATRTFTTTMPPVLHLQL